MPFRFSLQPLLNWKTSLEDQSRMRLATLLILLKAQEEEIEKLILRRLAHEQELKARSERGMPAGEYLLFKHYAEESRKELTAKENKKRKTLAEIEQERQRLLAITKEKKALERLKEKRFKEFRHSQEKAEQKRADEAATLKYRPRSQGDAP
jgi:flagellar FliJ protein